MLEHITSSYNIDTVSAKNTLMSFFTLLHLGIAYSTNQLLSYSFYKKHKNLGITHSKHYYKSHFILIFTHSNPHGNLLLYHILHGLYPLRILSNSAACQKKSVERVARARPFSHHHANVPNNVRIQYIGIPRYMSLVTYSW